MYLIKEGRFQIRISHEEGEVYQFAASELFKYLQMMAEERVMGIYQTAEKVPKTENKEPTPVYVGSLEWCAEQTGESFADLGLKYDGFAVLVSEKRIVLTGKKPRSALFAAYCLLKKAGCRWAFPGLGGEYVPICSEVEVSDEDILSSPDYEYRTINFDGCFPPVDMFIANSVGFVDWMAKNYLNSYHLHFRLGNGPYTLYQDILPLCQKRGMHIEAGGHGFELLVAKRDLFETRPEIFRFQNGERRNDGNYCAMADDAKERAYEAVKSILDSYPGIHNIHAYFADLEEGGWCSCDRCKDMTPSQQANRLMDYAARRLEEEGYDVRLTYVLYHDTLDCESLKGKTECPKNLLGLYAPRERCYTHSIGDPNCKKNQKYLAALKNCVDYFGKNTVVFEYYMDIILYTNMKVVIPHTIAADMRDYRALGIEKIEALHFGRVGYCLYNLNYFAYALCAWDANVDIDRALDDIYQKYFGDLWQDAKAYYALAEEALKYALAFCNLKRDYDLRMMFHVNGENKAYRAIRDGVKMAHDKVERCAEMVNNMLMKATGRAAYILVDEREWLRITLAELEVIHLRMVSLYERQIEGKLAEGYEHMLESFAAKRKEQELLAKIPTEVNGTNGCGAGSVAYSHNCNDQIRWHKQGLDEDIPKEIRRDI